MPYTNERASKISHLDVIKSPFVKKLVKRFQADSPPAPPETGEAWENLPPDGDILSVIYAVDGSYQEVHTQTSPSRGAAFVKTALVRIDQTMLERVDPHCPHPYMLRDLLDKSALHHATMFPLKNFIVKGESLCETTRNIIVDSLREDPLEGAPFETLKWLLYEKWSSRQPELRQIPCPHCGRKDAVLPYDADSAPCPRCGEELRLIDWLGFHRDFITRREVAPLRIATAYMNLHELLLLFSGIRIYWENDQDMLSRCLFIRDGPLSVNEHYARIVYPIRRFLQHAKDENVPIYLMGQEKTGWFVDHLELACVHAPAPSFFVPDITYIHEQVLGRPGSAQAYGEHHVFGWKVFLYLGPKRRYVLTVPTGKFSRNTTRADLVGLPRILATVQKLVSFRHPDAIFPLELAHGIASLSSYPSAKILSLFAAGRSS